MLSDIIMKKGELNIGIAGAGIMGRLLAWQLVQQGCRVTLFDKDPIARGSAAAFTAAGMLSPYSEIETADLSIFNMGINSLNLWPKIVKDLKLDVGFQQQGSLVVSHANDKADLDRFNQQLSFKFDQLSETDNKRIPSQLNQEKLSKLEPELAQSFSKATYLPQEAWLNTKCVMNSLATQLLPNLICWHAHTHVDDIGPNYILANDTKHQFDWAVDCRGLGAKDALPELRGVRGELIVLQAPEVKINRLVRLMHPRYRLYLVPRGKDSLYTIGATQIESDDSGPITVRSTLELLSAVYSLHPGFAEAKIIECKTNCRPALPNNQPKIAIEDGLIHVNGLYRHGFLLAPTLADEVSNFLLKGKEFLSQYPQIIKQQAY